MTLELSNRFSIPCPKSDYFVIASRRNSASRPVVRGQLREAPNDICMPFDRLQWLPIEVEYADDLVGTSCHYEFVFVNQQAPNRPFMTQKLSCNVAAFHIPDKDLFVPGATDNFAAIIGEGQAGDVARMPDEHTMCIISQWLAHPLDIHERFPAASCNHTLRMLLRRCSICQAIEPIRALQRNCVVKGRRLWRSEGPLSDSVVARGRQDEVSVGEDYGPDLESELVSYSECPLLARKTVEMLETDRLPACRPACLLAYIFLVAAQSG